MLPLLSALTCARESRTLITLSPDMGMVLNHQYGEGSLVMIVLLMNKLVVKFD